MNLEIVTLIKRKSVVVKNKRNGFFLIFFSILGVALAFEPGTNGNNVPDFTSFKLTAFVIICLMVEVVILIPAFFKPWNHYLKNKLYYFFGGIMFFTVLIYLFQSTWLLIGRVL